MKVLNRKTDHIPSEAVYIGRPSIWGNPFVIGKDGNRDEVIAKYATLMTARLASADGVYWSAELNKLIGKDLVCWCSPAACHGDVLLKLANE